MLSKEEILPVLSGDQAPAAARSQRTPVRRLFRRIDWIVIARVLVVVGILALWEFASGRWLKPIFFSSPSAAFKSLIDMIASGEMLKHAAATWTAFAIGYPIGAIAGIALGIFFGVFQRLSEVAQPYIQAVYSIPKIALAPFFILIFGVGLQSKVALVAMSVFLFVFLSTFTGVRSINPELVQLAQIMGGDGATIARKVYIPSALPYIVVGLRGTVPYGIIGAIVGEYIASNRGLGWLIQRGANSFNVSSMIAAIVVLVLTTTFLLRILTLAERRLIRWGGHAEEAPVQEG